MVSAAEQLASNMNFGVFAKATELKKRIWFTLGVLIAYRFGTYIPLPGIDPVIMNDIFRQNAGGVLGMLDMFAGGAISRMSIFALNIMPYISASIIVQLCTAIVPSMEALKKEGEAGRKKLNQYTRYGTVALAAVQAYAIAIGLEGMRGTVGSAVTDPGMFFRVVTVITLTGGTLFLMWMGEQITARGIGNGQSLIIFAGIVAHLPTAFAQLFELARTGAISTTFLLVLVVMAIAVITFIVFCERAMRKVVVQYPRRQTAQGATQAESSFLPMKLNTAGVIPPIFASSLLLLPLTFTGFVHGDSPEWLRWIATHVAHGQPAYMALYALLIIFFAFFYTAIVFNPAETAENLRKYGGFVPGIRPGATTANYLDFVLTRLTVLGSLYLALVCLLPEFLIAEHAVPFYFGGTSLLIVVSVTLDTVQQINAHLIQHQYEGLIKKAKLRGRA